MKFQDDITFQNITVAKFHCPKFEKRTITKKYLMNCFQVFTKYSIHHPLSGNISFMLLALIFLDTAFTMFHPL